MSARASKRRRLDCDETGPETSGAISQQTKNSERIAQDDEAEEIIVTRPSQARTSPAAKKAPTPSHGSTSAWKVPTTAPNAPSSPAAPRSSTSAWREAKKKSLGYRRRMTKEELDSIPTASTTTITVAARSKTDPHDGIEGAQIAVRPRDRPTKVPPKTTGPGKGRGVRAKPNALNGRNGDGDEIHVAEEAPKKRTDKEDEDELAEDQDDRMELSKRMGAYNHAGSPAKKLASSSGPVKSTKKPLDRRKAKQLLIAEDEGGTLFTEEIEHETRDMVEDIEMLDISVPVSTPRAGNLFGPQTITITKATPEMARMPTTDITSLSFSSQDLMRIQHVVLEKATGKRQTQLVNVDTEYAKVYAVVNQTITAGESNSMLVIGARGCGKSALVNKIIHEQKVQHPDDFLVVRLNGFIHTDDKIALRDIWRQLGREMDLGDEASSKNYADTLTTLLALLSHPTETGTDQEGQITKSVIFIIDEFELFAHHPRQTLLYNLFDIAQSRKAPIAVLGLTTKIDVAESLEKRVKSRFSHRYVHLGLAKSFQAFEDTCKSAMSIATDELSETEKSEFQVSLSISSKLKKASSEQDEAQPKPLIRWSQLIDHIFCANPTQNLLRRLYYTNKSVPQFITSLLFSTATMPTEPSTTASDLLSHFESTLNSSLQPPDSKLSLLSSLSMLQLGLLVCAARLTAIHDAETVSFALAYDEYKNLASKVKLQASASGAIAQGAGSRVWGRDVAKNAWGALIECGFIMEDGRAGGVGRVDIGLEEIGMSEIDLGFWGRWCKEI